MVPIRARSTCAGRFSVKTCYYKARWWGSMMQLSTIAWLDELGLIKSPLCWHTRCLASAVWMWLGMSKSYWLLHKLLIVLTDTNERVLLVIHELLIVLTNNNVGSTAWHAVSQALKQCTWLQASSVVAGTFTGIMSSRPYRMRGEGRCTVVQNWS